MKIKTFHILFLTLIIGLFMAGCSESGKVEQSEADANLLLGLVIGQQQGVEQGKQTESSKDFILNGQWNSYTGSTTTGNTIQTFAAKTEQKGLILSDSADFGGYTSCSILFEFDNSVGYYIYQNPENNGGCFANDTNKGKFFKAVFFKNTEKENSYWYCTLNFPGVDTIEAARAIEDNSNKTTPGTSGCGSFNSAWSRLEKK